MVIDTYQSNRQIFVATGAAGSIDPAPGSLVGNNMPETKPIEEVLKQVQQERNTLKYDFADLVRAIRNLADTCSDKTPLTEQISNYLHPLNAKGVVEELTKLFGEGAEDAFGFSNLSPVQRQAIAATVQRKLIPAIYGDE